MTLIAFYRNPKLIALSDALISWGACVPGRHISLPLTGRVHSDEPMPNVGLAQKCVILRPDELVLWSGSGVIAETMMKNYVEFRNSGGLKTFPEFSIAHFSKSEFNQVTLICAKLPDDDDGESEIVDFHLNVLGAKEEVCSGYELITGGSGGNDFFHGTDMQSRNSFSPVTNQFNQIIGRIGEAMAREYVTFASENLFSPLEARYGGWWELAIYQFSQNSFRKMPYLVKFWTLIDGVLTGVKGYQCWYEGHHLKILAYRDVGNGPERKLYWAEDFLKRAPAIDLAIQLPAQQPEFQIHVVLQKEKYVPHIVLKGFDVEFDDVGFKETIADSLRDCLANGTANSEVEFGRVY